MPKADLYLDQVDLCAYWPTSAPIPCPGFLARRQAVEITTDDYPFLTIQHLQSFKLVLEAAEYLPTVPLLTIPQPTEAGLLPINEPDSDSLVIVSGNSRLTFEVLATIWAQGVTPAYFLLVDCLGSTVDMAMFYGDFTPDRLVQVLRHSGLEEKVKHRHMIVPGLTLPLARDFSRTTGWEIEVGPVCAVELPLFLGNRWVFPETQL